MQTSQQKRNDFDVEAQCSVEQYQDYLDGRCADQEGVLINDGLDVIRSFVASKAFEQYSLRAQQNQVMPLSVRKQEQRRALWQKIMDDEIAKRRDAYRYQMYLESKKHAESVLAEQGLYLESDSEEDLFMDHKDRAIIQDRKFTERFQNLFDVNLNKLHTSVSQAVVEDVNRYFTIVAYKSLADMGIDARSHKALWNSIKIKSCNAVMHKSNLAKANFSDECRNKYTIVQPQKKSPGLSAQMNEVASPKKAAPVMKSPTKKKLTPAQQAKEDAETKFLDEQIALRQQEAARVTQTSLSSLKNNNSNQSQSMMAAAHDYAKKLHVADDLESDDISLDEFKSRCTTKVTKDGYEVLASVPKDSFEQFYKKTPSLIALVKKYENKDAGALIKDPQFERFINKFMIALNIPAQQRVAMQTVFNESAALVWKSIAHNCSKR